MQLSFKVSNMKRLSVSQWVSQDSSAAAAAQSELQIALWQTPPTPLLAFVQGKKSTSTNYLQLIFTACEEDVMLVASSTRNLCEWLKY
jgi:hypothetical protein